MNMHKLGSWYTGRAEWYGDSLSIVNKIGCYPSTVVYFQHVQEDS